MVNKAQLFTVAVILLMPLAALVSRIEMGAQEALSKGIQSEMDGHLDEAAYQYQRSAKWNSLFSRTSEEAYDRLNQLGQTAEQSGDKKLALLCNRYVRAAIMSTRHLWRDDSTKLAEVNRSVARLTAEVQLSSGAPTIRGRSLDVLTSDHLKLLEKRYGPTPLKGTLVFILFLAWIGATIWTIWRGLGADGKVKRNELVRGSAAALLMFCGFCAMLSVV